MSENDSILVDQKGTKVKSKKLIAVFTSEVSAKIQGNLYIERHKKAKILGYHLVFFSGTYDKQYYRYTTKVSRDLYSLAENMDFAAFFIHAQAIGDRDMIDKLIDQGRCRQIPVFVYDGETVGISKREGVFFIDPDYKQGFAESVRHLIEFHHCRNIFMLAGLKNNKFSDDRIEMYRKEMEAHGIDYVEEQIGYGDFWENPAIEALNKFFDSGLPAPDAICCANDSMAITAVNVLRKRGYRVPEDVRVTGFDGIEEGKYNYPSISTCEPNMEAVADYVFAVLDGTVTSEEYMAPLIFCPKDSCGCASENIENFKKEMPRLFENVRVNAWQDHMIATMQFELIDCCLLDELVTYMNGTLDLINSQAHLFCFRDDIEYHEDLREPFDRMRVFLNRRFLEDKKYDSFSVSQIMPDLDRVLEEAAPEDMLFFKLIHSGDKKYGYHIVRAGYYSSNELSILGQFTESVTIVIESILRNMRLMLANRKLSEMYERMSQIYIRDTMTELYNRHGYYQSLEEYLKREDLKNGFLHIISIDMDGMKAINDHYGHLEGDHAISSVAHAINDCFSQPCISARFGGDEFMVAIFTEDGEEPSNERISMKLNQYLKNSVMLAGKEYEVGVSVGQAIVKISEIKDIKTIEKLADDCMYEEKRKRKNRRG